MVLYGKVVDELEYVMVKMLVWWDFENCQVLKGCDVYKIVFNIKLVVEKMKYCGLVIIYVYGDIN